MIKLVKKLLIVMIVSVFLISMVTATAYAVTTTKLDKKGTSAIIESKEKTVKYTITWNGNGGKIGTKNTLTTYVKKGSKINKLATSPKRTGYSFKGWYTKKTGGTKISKNTKPSKSVTYYAQYNKASSGLSTTEKKLVGKWNMVESSIGSLKITSIFAKDKTFSELIIRTSIDNRGRVSYTKSSYKGYWSVSGDTIYYTNVQYQRNNDNWKSTTMSPDKLRFGSDEKGQYFLDEYDRRYYKS